jgi:hypothetical protein
LGETFGKHFNITNDGFVLLAAAVQVPSPFKPSVKSIESIENFDACWVNLPVQVGSGAGRA